MTTSTDSVKHSVDISAREYIEARLESQKELITAMRAYIDAQTRSGELALQAHQTYVIERFVAAEKAVAAALAAADRAVSKAEATTEERLKGMNEFRDALGDYSRTLMPRPESEAIQREMKEKLDAITLRITTRENMPRAESEKMHLDTKEKIEAIVTRLNNIDARSHGRTDMWGWVAGGIGLLIAVVTIANKLFGG